jgi:hypothetical protein
VPASKAKTKGETEEPEPSRRRADSRATVALRTRAAALKATWMRLHEGSHERDGEVGSDFGSDLGLEAHDIRRRPARHEWLLDGRLILGTYLRGLRQNWAAIGSGE